MIDPNPPRPDRAAPASAESFARILARPLLVLLVLGAVAGLVLRRGEVRTPKAPRTEPATAPRPVVVAAPPRPSPARPAREEAPAPPPPPAPPQVDREAVARAEQALDAASRDRARADARLADAARSLEVATTRAAAEAAKSRTLVHRVRDPSARIQAASAKAQILRAERDRLAGEVVALDKVEAPKAKALLAKSAVAKPTEGTEYHFEVRRNRVAFIDLDRLVDQVKADARLRLRIGGGATRGAIAALVGPVGSFSLRYRMARAISDDLSDLLDAREVTYTLQSWEVIPEGENRGEPYEMTRSTSSEFGRAIRRLNPERDTITMWIYPDGFSLYRRLRDDLHERGFTVAARPLPAGMAIRGSPSGSLSAGQ
ncbi:hypothetical protein TA3x_002659 [Tundrisphaera sp. TA3]|uniref:hypothetical protein n=1 Tax=Tundrisphaera sp. TA3 TaxID=3435775 RepID=UPI003EB8517B